MPTTSASASAAADPSVRNARLTAGVGILLMALLAPFGALFAIQSRVTEGDAARTAADIMASEGLFRLGILSMFVVIALDVVVAFALYRVFSSVNRHLSLLAAGLRLVFAGVFLVAVTELLGVLRLLGSDDYLSVFTPGQLQAQALLRVNAFNDVWQAGLFLFGLHLLVLGYLAYKSGYMHKLLGVLLAIAGAGYVFDSAVSVLFRDSVPSVSTVTFLGEFLLALWLVTRGRRVVSSEAQR